MNLLRAATGLTFFITGSIPVRVTMNETPRKIDSVVFFLQFYKLYDVNMLFTFNNVLCFRT